MGVGVTHISHLETGSGTVSLKVFLAIVNYLECSADELLCKEITTARPIVDNWLVDLVADCDQTEIKIEYSAPPEQGVRRVRATVPVGQGQCSGR